jgi:hypothetical protein
MKKLVAVLAGLLVSAVIAGPAFGEVATGTLEICKSSVTGPLAVTGAFTFTVAPGDITRTVNVGQCSGPITVPAGTVTITETGPGIGANGYVSVASAVQERPTGPTNLALGGPLGSTVAVTVAPGGPESETLVRYTDQLVTGTIEVCKQAAAGSGLSGNFSFALENLAAVAAGVSANPTWARTSVSVPVGGCSNPITILAGTVRVTETDAGPGGVFSITTPNGASLSNINLVGASVDVAVNAGTTSSNAPIVTFTNNSALLKVCKIAGQGVALGTSYAFSATAAGGQASNFSVTAGTAATGGNCVTVATFRPNTTVTISEGIVPGTWVSSIAVDPSGRLVPGSLSLGARTVSVVVGAGTTIVTYTNSAAPPGTLKICKATGAGVGAGPYTFTVGANSVSVMAGSCAIVGGAVTPILYPFMSQQTVVETAAGTSVTSIVTAPATRLASFDLAGRSAVVWIGDPNTQNVPGETIVTFTNGVAGAAPTGGSPPPSGGSGGSGGESAQAPATSSSTKTAEAAAAPAVAAATAKTTALAGKTPAIVGAKNVVSLAKFVKYKKKRWVAVKVKSPAKMAKVKITLLAKNGKAFRAYTRTVKTNQLVRVLPVNANAFGIRVAALEK